MKRTIWAFVIMVLFGGTALAAPLDDYSLGKTAVDLNVIPNDDSHLTNDKGYDQSPNSKSGMDFGVTTGLGNNFALQYRQFNVKTKDFNDGYFSEAAKLSNAELNLLYQVDKNWSTFIGSRWSTLTDYIPLANTSYFAKRNVMQFGLTGSCLIADRTSLYGSVTAGHDLSAYEVGLSYKFTENLEGNLFYKDINVKNIQFPTVQSSSEFKGLGYGITYQF